MVTKGEILFTAGSYVEPTAKTFITAGYSARRGPIGHKSTVIRITAGYIKTVGEGPGDELTFCSSESTRVTFQLFVGEGTRPLTITRAGHEQSPTQAEAPPLL
jgi:hypothetical protein